MKSHHHTPADTPEPQVGSRRKADDDEHNSRSAKKARTRVSYSCGECHRRKQKCDRQMPCSHCIARKVPELCQPYTPGKSDQDLHARLARVEHVLAVALPDHWNASHSGSHHGNGTDHRGSPSPGADDDKASQGDDEDVSGGIYDSGRWYGNAASGSVAASAMLEKLQNVVDSKPPTHEPTPNPLSVDHLPSDIFKNDVNTLLAPSDSSPADNLKALVQECGVSPHKISELLHELPARSLTDKLVDLYFTGSNWTRYPLSEKNFRAGYNSIYNDGAAVSPNEFRFLPLLFVILAISVRLAPEQISGDSRTRRLMSQRYYWCSRRSLLIAAAIHTDCLEVVITRLLSARFLLFDRKMTECWSQLGAAVRTAQALGLHRDCGSLQGLDPFQVEHRRRIWSYLYHADRSYALVLGRPSAIQDDYTSTLPPSNVEDENNVLVRGPFPLTTPTRMTFIVLRNTLAGIMGRILHFFQKVNSARHYSDVLALDDELVKFTQSLPPYYSLDPDTSMDESHFYIPAHRFLLVTEILFVRITLHRPFLLRRLSSDRYLRSRKACFECAIQDFSIRHRFLGSSSSLREIRDPVTSAYREFQAAMISGIYLVLYPKGNEVETMNMIVDGFIHDHDRDVDHTTKRELTIIQFLKTKSQNILKGSPKSEDRSTMSSPALGDKPHTEAQLLLQLSNSSPRSGYAVNASRVAGPSFPSSGSGQVGSPVPYAISPVYSNASSSALPNVQNLQRSDSVSAGGSPGHEEESAAQSLLDQWCSVFSGGPVLSSDGMAGGQSLPWATQGISDMPAFLSAPMNQHTGGVPVPDVDGTDWSYWENLVNQIRSGPLA
ncbi:fungal-specific transcription factor domain-containing protein [Cytidiella melzeri]|nr:fungal-specific transcription factor domain-containing protein [Cytidiella melzeri]